MANRKSTSPVHRGAQAPTFAAKAPAVDPFLRPDSVTSQAAAFKGYALPPILSGVQAGMDLNGEPKDYDVSVMWADRRQVDALLDRIADLDHDMHLAVAVIRAYLCNLDTQRDETRLQLACAQTAGRAADAERTLQFVDAALSRLSRWDDARRLLIQ